MTHASIPTWLTAQHLLSTFDGEASELFVIDLPRSQLSHVLGVIASLPDLVIDAGHAGDSEVSKAVVQELQRIEAGALTDGVHAFVSAHGTSEHLQVYVLSSEAGDPFDLEIVFWNDLTFPRTLDSVELERRFKRIVGLAENCRAGVTEARCILATEHNGDPRELLAKPCVVVW
jgi:hypothetical protein